MREKKVVLVGDEKLNDDYIKLVEAIRTVKRGLGQIDCPESQKRVIKSKLQAAIDKFGYIISEFDREFDMDTFDKLVNHQAYFVHVKHRTYPMYIKKGGKDGK